MLFQLKAVSELSYLISFLIFALQIYRSAQSVNKVSGRLGDQCQNQEFWIWAAYLGAEGYSTHVKWEWKAFSCPWSLPASGHCQESSLGLHMGSRGLVGPLRCPCLLQKWQIRILSSSLYIWRRTWTRSTNTWLSQSFEIFSESFFHDFFQSFFPPNLNHRFACCYHNSKVLRTEESEMVSLLVADQSCHKEWWYIKRHNI